MRPFVPVLLLLSSLAQGVPVPEEAPAALPALPAGPVLGPAEGISPVDQAIADSSVHYSYGREYGYEEDVLVHSNHAIEG